MYPPLQFITLNGLRLAYIDFGGTGAPLVCLHGHFGRARMFDFLAEALPGWRIIALEQRGQGWSDHAEDYSREAYLADAAAFIEALGLGPALVLGHSLGGANAYQLAARQPALVRGLIIEDIGAICDDPSPCLAAWPRRFPSLRAAVDCFTRDGVLDTYFLESLVEYADGWGFRFDGPEMVHSQALLRGDWWADWLGSRCPALLIHGQRSHVLPTAHAREMAARRPHTTLVEFPHCGHNVHEGDKAGYAKAISEWLAARQL